MGVNGVSRSVKMKNYSILLVDDDPIITAGIGGDLEERGYNVTTADSGEAAIDILAESTFDLVITDLVMGTMGGLDVLKKAKEINPDMMAIVLTGFGDVSSAIGALRLDADDYLQKPCESEALHFRISRCLEKLELRREIGRYEEILPVCCVCKKIRDDSGKDPGKGKWMSLEEYMHRKAGVSITSTYCPECYEKAMEAPEREFPE